MMRVVGLVAQRRLVQLKPWLSLVLGLGNSRLLGTLNMLEQGEPELGRLSVGGVLPVRIGQGRSNDEIAGR